jgi:hypothetical protein
LEALGRLLDQRQNCRALPLGIALPGLEKGCKGLLVVFSGIPRFDHGIAVAINVEFGRRRIGVERVDRIDDVVSILFVRGGEGLYKNAVLVCLEHHIQLECVGRREDLPTWTPLEEANRRLQRALATSAPPTLLDRARAQLAVRLSQYLDGIVTAQDLQFGARVLFSARGVIAPGSNLRHDQIGVPEEIAWALFSAHVARRLGAAEEVAERSQETTAALDEVMAENWIILHRPPSLMPANFMAFRPLRVPGHAIRIHPLTTEWMNADFDGDQAALFLPITAAGQREAGARLSMASHHARDRSKLRNGRLVHDAMWGLAHLSRTEAGRQTIARTMGQPVVSIPLDRHGVHQALEGHPTPLDVLDQLMHLGFQTARCAGGSMGVFLDSRLDLPPKPPADDRDALESYSAEVQAVLAAFVDFDDDALGPVRLANVSGARASLHQLSILVGANVGRQSSAWSQAEGQPPAAFFDSARVAWGDLHKNFQEATMWHVPVWMPHLRQTHALPAGGSPTGGLLSRARMSRRPGVVFARAASQQEVDPLNDPVSHLWVGLP